MLKICKQFISSFYFTYYLYFFYFRQELSSEIENQNLRKNIEISQKLKEISLKSNSTIMARKIYTSEKSKSVNSESSSVTRESSAKLKPPKPVKNTVKLLPPLSISVYATTETEIPFYISSTTSSPNLILGGGNGPTGVTSLSPSYGSSRR